MKKLVNQIKNGLFGLNKVLSVSINLSDENTQLQGGVFKTTEGETDLIASLSEIDLKESLQKMPIILTLEGKGILHKLVDSEASKIKLRNIIPNIKEEDFLVNYTPQGQQTWVSLIRKDLVESTLKNTSIPQDNIIDFHLAPCPLQWLNGSVEELPTQIGDSELIFEEGKLIQVKKKTSPLTNQTLFGNSVEPNIQLALVSAIITLAGLNQGNVQSVWGNNFKIQKEKKVFYGTVKVVLGLLLLVFMGNMVINQLGKKSFNELSVKTQEKDGLVSRAVYLEGEAKQKEEFINILGLGDNPQFSLFADEIGATVPKVIQLNKLAINPLTKSIRKKKMIKFGNGNILIGGFCKTSQDCNEWVAQLRVLNWAKKVELIEFKFNKDNIGEFLVEVNY